MRRTVCAGCCAAVLFLAACGSTSVAPPPEKDDTPERYEANPSDAVSIALPERVPRAYFGMVAPQVLENVEIGSPDSLKTAISQLKNPHDEAERVLLFVAASVLQIVWPSESGHVVVPETDVANAYTGAIASARDGMYDFGTGNADFLAKVLPSLVLVTSHTRSDYYERAQADLTDALQDRADSVLANYLLGVLYQRMERFSEAADCFAKVVRLAPQCYEASFALAQVSLRIGDAQATFNRTQELLQQNHLNADVLKLAVESAFAAGDLDAAEQYAARVLQLENDNMQYLLLRAKILALKGDYIKAASLLDIYARTDTTARDYLLLRATLQKDWNRNTAGAVATVERALQLYPDDAEIMLAAAELASQTGQRIGGKTAGDLAGQILAKDAGNVAALGIQIAQLVQSRRYADAYRASSALLSLADVPASAVHTHIAICLQANHADEAWRLASGLYNDNPSDEVVLQSYIRVLVATGRAQEASRLIAQQLPSANARMKSFLYYERSFIAQGEDAVLSDLRSSLTSNPRNKDSLMRLYEIYYRKREYRKAQYYLKQVVALSPTDEHLLELDRELTALLSR